MHINGRTRSLWRAVDHEGGVLEAVSTKPLARCAALKRLKKRMKRYSQPQAVVTDRCACYGAALREIANVPRHVCTSHSGDASGRCCASGAWGRCRNSPPCTAPSVIASTNSVNRSADRPTRQTAPRLPRGRKITSGLPSPASGGGGLQHRAGGLDAIHRGIDRIDIRLI